MVIRLDGTGWGSGRGRRRSLLINQGADMVRWEQIQALVPAIEGDETVPAKVRGRGGRSLPVRIGIEPVTWRAVRRRRPVSR
ncbi:hypothetical protein [Streptomyces sp. NPDC001652]|uniref:hypothetical protein n=1 Tax=Streptomyces sp. NPDC001652 TaxID=3154393 RepID=UPI00332941C3